MYCKTNTPGTIGFWNWEYSPTFLSKCKIFLSPLIFEKFLQFKVKKSEIYCYLDQPFRSSSKITLTDKIDQYGRYIPYINLPDYSDELLSVSYVQNKLGLLFSNSSFEFKKYQTSIYWLWHRGRKINFKYFCFGSKTIQ